MSRGGKLAIGVAASLLLAWLYHAPLGAGTRFEQRIETTARATLVHYGIGTIAARLGSSPQSRTLLLSGPADDFQRGELVRILGEIQGVGRVRWVSPGATTGGGLPLLAEVELLALAAFGLGLLLARLIEWRRRSHE